MADTGAPYFIPYVEPTDLVRDYPAADEAQADAIAAALDGIPVLAGIGSNVVQTVKTDTFAASAAPGAYSSDVTGLTATITPSSATSKILVMASVHGSNDSGNSILSWRLMRGATAIGIADADSNRARNTAGFLLNAGDNASISNVAAFVLDSPGVGTAVTYAVQLFNFSGASRTLFVNRSFSDANSATVGQRMISSITAIEVAA